MDVGILIKRATKVPSGEVSNVLIVHESLLAPIKKICKSDENSIIDAFRYLSIDLQRKNGIVRLRSLYIIEQLFQRSKLFRKAVSQNINCIVNCAGLFHGMSSSIDNDALASSYREEIENKVKELIEIWDSSHGSLYPEIHVVARYLRETLRIVMPNIQLRRQQAEAQELARRDQANKVILLQCSKILSDLNDTCYQVKNILDRIEECFNILFPRLYSDLDDATTDVNSGEESYDDTFEDIDWIDADDKEEENPKVSEPQSSSSTNIETSESSNCDVDLEAVGAVPFTIEFTLKTGAQDITTADNEILISIIHELSKQLINHVVPKLLSWKSVLTKAVPLMTSDLSNNINNTSENSRKRSIDDLNNAQYDKKQDTHTAIVRVRAMLEQIHSVLLKKCKQFFQ